MELIIFQIPMKMEYTRWCISRALAGSRDRISLLRHILVFFQWVYLRLHALDFVAQNAGPEESSRVRGPNTRSLSYIN